MRSVSQHISPSSMMTNHLFAFQTAKCQSRGLTQAYRVFPLPACEQLRLWPREKRTAAVPMGCVSVIGCISCVETIARRKEHIVRIATRYEPSPTRRERMWVINQQPRSLTLALDRGALGQASHSLKVHVHDSAVCNNPKDSK